MYIYSRAKDFSSREKQGIHWKRPKFDWTATPSKHCSVKDTLHNQHRWVNDSGLVWMCSGRLKKKYANTVV